MHNQTAENNKCEWKQQCKSGNRKTWAPVFAAVLTTSMRWDGGIGPVDGAATVGNLSESKELAIRECDLDLERIGRNPFGWKLSVEDNERRGERVPAEKRVDMISCQL